MEAQNQAWMVAASALEVAQQEVDQVSAAAMQEAHGGTAQHRAEGFAAALPEEVARQFRPWLGSVAPDMRRETPLSGEMRGHGRRSGSRPGHHRRPLEIG